MMGFAVILCFEPEAEARLRALWQALAGAAISSTMATAGIRPHVTLAGFEGGCPAGLCDRLQALARATPPLSVAFAALGVFPTSEGVLYLAPVVTMPLLALHAQLHAQIAGLGVAQARHYQVGHWVPHCTVALGLPPEKTAGALELCRRHDVFRPAQITEISLVETSPAGKVCAYALTGHGQAGATTAP